MDGGSNLCLRSRFHFDGLAREMPYPNYLRVSNNITMHHFEITITIIKEAMQMPYPNHLLVSNITDIIRHHVILTITIIFARIFYLAALSQSPNHVEETL